MTIFKIITNNTDIQSPNTWAGKGRTVGENGSPITPHNYRGKQYRLIDEEKYHFTTIEKVGRGFLGVVAAVCTLGIAILFKSIRELFTQEHMITQFALPVTQTKKFDRTLSEDEISKNELQYGMDISQKTISKIEICMNGIVNKLQTEDYKLYNSKRSHYVFSLSAEPKYIFKINIPHPSEFQGPYKPTKERYDKMVKAQTICRTHALGLLVIPKAKLFEIEYENKKYDIIAEEKLELDPSKSKQEEHFKTFASNLNETIRQLAVFICKTGYSDVEWRNNPVLNDDPDKFGCKKIALIDLEDMDGSTTGLFGGGWNRGLVRCVTEKQGNIVRRVAKEYNIPTDAFTSAHTERIAEISDNEQLEEYYSAHKITTGFEPIVVNINTLNLNLTTKVKYESLTLLEDKKTLQTVEAETTLENVAHTVIKEINEQITKKDDNYKSIKDHRNILLPQSLFPIQSIELIINALIKHKYLFKLKKHNGRGYYIQA